MAKYNLSWREYDDGTIDLIANNEVIGTLKDSECGEKFSATLDDFLKAARELGFRDALTYVGGIFMLTGIIAVCAASHKAPRISKY